MIKIKSIFSKILTILEKNQNLLLTLSIIFIAAFWRLYKIDTIPSFTLPSETTLLDSVKGLAINNWHIAPAQITNALYLEFFAIFAKFISAKMLYLRIIQGIIGTLTVWLFYGFVKNWFNRQTAMLAGLFLATNAFHLITSRTLNPEILIIPTIIAILYLVTSSLRTNKTIYFILSGLVVGAAFYVDEMFILLPLASIVALVYLYYKNKKGFFFYLKKIILAISVTSVVLIPYIYYLPKFFPAILSSFKTSFGNFYLNLGSVIQTLLYNGQLNGIYKIGSEPVVDPLITVSFVTGIIYAIFYMRRKKLLIITSWFFLLLFAISLKTTADYTNLTFLLVPVLILASLMLDYVLTNWVRTFPFNKVARLIMTFVFSLFIFLSVFYNYQKYFKAWNYNLKNNINIENQQK